ncbi:MAG TPA: hypothetical protein VN754_10810 [Candidatus Binataceae bacterium]|nr:hypothetical protein [Candidatus Binataceae bacterium]
MVAAFRQCGRFSQPDSQKNAVNSASSQASRSALLRLIRVSPEMMTHFSFSLASSDNPLDVPDVGWKFVSQGHDVVVLVEYVQRMGDSKRDAVVEEEIHAVRRSSNSTADLTECLDMP